MKRQIGAGTARAPAVVVVVAVVILMAAACGGNGSGGAASVSSSAATGAGSASPLAFSHCMRSHDVPNFPDPTSGNVLPKVGPQQLGVSEARFQQAQSACAHLLRPADEQVEQALSGMRDFASCMRDGGVQDWPDPSVDGDGQPVFDLRGRVDPDSPQVSATSDECAPRLHPAPGQNGTVLCDGVGEDGCHHYG